MDRFPSPQTRACWRPRALAALGLLLMVGAYFAPWLLDGRLLAPADGVAQYFPTHVLVAESLRQGEIPFWNPFNFSGSPMLAAIQPAVFFPPNLLFLILPPVFAMNVVVMAAFAVAGFGAYRFSRAIGVTRFGALVAGGVFMLCGYMAQHAEHLTMLQAVGLFPLLLWAVERFRQTLRPAYAIAGCLFLAMQILAGHPQMVAYSLLVTGAYALWRGVSLPANERLRYAFPLVAMVCLGVGLCALQLLPTLELIQASQRQSMTYERLTYHSLPPAALPMLLFPFFYGAGAPSAWFPTLAWKDWEWMAAGTEQYVGLVAVVLALIALVGRPREGQVRFWGAVALVALVLALGRHTPVYHLWGQLPVVKQMPYASRHLMEFSLAVAVLAGLGANAIARRAGLTGRRVVLAIGAVGLALGAVWAGVALLGPRFVERAQPVMPKAIDLTAAFHAAHATFWLPVVGVGAIAALLALWWTRPQAARWAQAGLLALLVADQLVLSRHLGMLPNSHVAPRQLPAFTLPSPDGGRTASIPVSHFPYGVPEGPPDPALGTLWRLFDLHYPTMAHIRGDATVNGYDAFILKRYQQLLEFRDSGGYLGWSEGIWGPGHHALDVLGLRTLRLEPAVYADPTWQERLQAPRWRRLPDEGDLVVFANPRALPRAWRPGRLTVAPLDVIDGRMRTDVGFRPLEEALVESPLAASRVSAGTARGETRSFNRIGVETDGPGPGLVVVSETHDPGWRAFTGDRELPIHRVDGLLLGIEVPAGRQAVELRYEPPTWRMGLAVSGVSGLLLGLWLWLTRRSRRPA